MDIPEQAVFQTCCTSKLLPNANADGLAILLNPSASFRTAPEAESVVFQTCCTSELLPNANADGLA